MQEVADGRPSVQIQNSTYVEGDVMTSEDVADGANEVKQTKYWAGKTSHRRMNTTTTTTFPSAGIGGLSKGFAGPAVSGLNPWTDVSDQVSVDPAGNAC